MGRKIIGATVGTTLNPKKIEEILGLTPNKDGNVTLADGRVIYFGTTLPEDAPAGSILIDLSEQNGSGVSKEMLEAIVAEALSEGVQDIVAEAVKEEVKDAVPQTLPNPFALTFTGAVEGSYDGSKAVTVNIPMGGSGDEWEFIGEFNVGKADVAEWIITEDSEGKPIELKEMWFDLRLSATASTTTNTTAIFGNPALGRLFASNAYYASIGASLRPAGNTVTMHVTKARRADADDFEMLAMYATAMLNVTWQQGRSNAGAPVLKNCLGGFGIKSADANTGLIGAGSTVKIWGVRM